MQEALEVGWVYISKIINHTSAGRVVLIELLELGFEREAAGFS